MSVDLKSRKSFGIPDPLAPDNEKKDKSYGLKWAIAIQQEWFNGGMIVDDCLFTERYNDFKSLRSYVRGESDLNKDKHHISREPDDLSLHNLDFTPINYAEKFTNKVVNGISSDYYRVDVRSIDRFSALQKKEKYNKHLTNMAANPMLKKAAQLGLPDVSEKGFVPEDEEELNLYTQIKERPLQEISEEILIDYAKKTNRFDYIKGKTDRDLVNLDMQVVEVFTDENNGVTPRYVDPENFVHSFVQENDFSDAFYFGYIDTITINELRRESGFDDNICRKIAKQYAGQNKINQLNSNFSNAKIEDLLDIKINVLRFTFKSDKEVVFKRYLDKRNRTKKVALRDENYSVPEGAEKSKLTRRFDTWYEGNYVVGSNEYIYDYQESEILAKDKMNKVLPRFIVQSTNIYRNKTRSFLKNIIPLCDQLQRIHLKTQHLIAELKPDMIEIDLDHIADLVGDSKGDPEKNIKKAISFLNVKGVVFKKRADLGEEGIKDGNSARPIPNQQGSALGALLNTWSFYYKQIEDITGVSAIKSDSLVGTNQMIQLSNNTATKHIVDASVMFDKRICETISSRIKGIFKFERLKHLRETLSDAIGSENIDALEGIENRSIHEFGFTIEMVPATEELNYLREDLGIAIQDGTIDVSDKTEIMAIGKNNMKQARQYMHFVRNRNLKQKTKEAQLNMQMQSENNIKSSQAKQQGELALYQQKKMIDLQYESKKSALDLQKQAQEMQLKEPLRQEEFRQDVYLEKIKGLTVINRDEAKEKAKDERLDTQSTQQSKLIEQRKKDTGAVDFTRADLNIEELLGIE